MQLRLPIPLPLFIPRSVTDSTIGETLEAIDRSLSRGPLIARVAILLDPSNSSMARALSRSLAGQRRSQIAVLDQRDIEELLLSKGVRSRRLLQQVIVRDIDLSLVSPFISEGPTPPQMFFGRDLELRRIHEQIERQSFALVGGRKAGKTSMLRRLHKNLSARFPTIYIDCQAHPDREDFLSYLLDQKDAERAKKLSPVVPHAEAIIRSFVKSQFHENFGVILFDEVDPAICR